MSSGITPAHRRLAQRYGKLPFRFPVNDLLAELLCQLFSEDEARLAAAFPLRPADCETIAQRAGVLPSVAQPLLESLDHRGVICGWATANGRRYLLLPIIPGIFELQMWRGVSDPATLRFAELVERYYDRHYYSTPHIKGVVKIIPLQRHIESQPGVLPSDAVSELIDSHTSFVLAECCCRRSATMRGVACDKPLEVCMGFGPLAEYAVARGMGRRVDRSEIRDAVARAEEAGLVHLSDNVRQSNFLCSCCACCCTALKVIVDFQYPWMVTKSRFLITADLDRCQGCGACVKRCPTGALRVDVEITSHSGGISSPLTSFRSHRNMLDMPRSRALSEVRDFPLGAEVISTSTLSSGEQTVAVDAERCIGCGVCVSGCSKRHALSLVPREVYDPPPESFAALGADISLQVFGLKRALNGWAPRAYQRLRRWTTDRLVRQVKK